MKKILDFIKNRKMEKEFNNIANEIYNEINFIVKGNIELIKSNSKDDNDKISLNDLQELEAKGVLYFEAFKFLLWIFIETNIFTEKQRKIILDKIHKKIYDSSRKQGMKYDELKFVESDINDTYKYYNECYLENGNYSECSNKMIQRIIRKEDFGKINKNLNLYLYIKLFVNNINKSGEKMMEKCNAMIENYRNSIS